MYRNLWWWGWCRNILTKNHNVLLTRSGKLCCWLTFIIQTLCALTEKSPLLYLTIRSYWIDAIRCFPGVHLWQRVVLLLTSHLLIYRCIICKSLSQNAFWDSWGEREHLTHALHYYALLCSAPVRVEIGLSVSSLRISSCILKKCLCFFTLYLFT